MIKMLSEFPDLSGVYISNSKPTGIIRSIIQSTESIDTSSVLSRMTLISCYNSDDLITTLELLLENNDKELGLVVIDPITPLISVLHTSNGAGYAVMTRITTLLKKVASIKYCCVLVSVLARVRKSLMI